MSKMSKKSSNCRSKWQQEKFVNYRVAKKRQKNLVKLSRLAAKSGKQNCIFTKNTEIFLKSERKFKLLMKIDVLFTFWHSSQQRLRKICTWHLNKLRFVMINWNRSKETTDKRQIFRLQVTQVRNAFKAFLSV